MKNPSKESAFTLVELLVLIVVIAILASTLLPVLSDRKPALIAQCISNQRYLALGFIMYQDEHHGQFPWQVLNTNGVVKENIGSVHAAAQFVAAADYLKSFRAFICPTDHAKTAATNYSTFSDANTSYFVGFDVGTNQAVTILTGDRHLVSNGKPAGPGLFNYSNGISTSWSRELHGDVKWPTGCLSFTDGHGEAVRGSDLTSIFKRQGSITIRAAVP